MNCNTTNDKDRIYIRMNVLCKYNFFFKCFNRIKMHNLTKFKSTCQRIVLNHSGYNRLCFTIFYILYLPFHFKLSIF